MRRFPRRSLPIVMERPKRTTTMGITVTTGEVTTAITIGTGTIITGSDNLLVVAERLRSLHSFTMAASDRTGDDG